MAETNNNVFTKLKEKLGASYALRIIEKDLELTKREVVYVFSGNCKNPDRVKKVLDAAEKVVDDIKANNEKINTLVTQLTEQS